MYSGGNLSERGVDAYWTPDIAVHALERCETLPPFILEPMAGAGNIVSVLDSYGHGVTAFDLYDYGSPRVASGVDFLTWNKPAECIVSNPPFKDAAKYIKKAIEISPLVCMLLRLSYLEGGIRDKDRAYVLDKLSRVHVFAKRLPRMHRYGYEGPTAPSGMAFAWFVWDQSHEGKATIDRI